MALGETHNKAEAVFADSRIVAVDQAQVVGFCERAIASPRGRYRLCSHQASDSIHEMLICLDEKTFVRPHKHQGKSESIHVISGLARLILFDEQGQITNLVALGPYESGRTFFHRIGTPVYHTLWLETPSFVFHETTQGPYLPEQTLYAPWSPPEDSRDIEAFQTRIARQVGQWGKSKRSPEV